MPNQAAANPALTPSASQLRRSLHRSSGGLVAAALQVRRRRRQLHHSSDGRCIVTPAASWPLHCRSDGVDGRCIAARQCSSDGRCIAAPATSWPLHCSSDGVDGCCIAAPVPAASQLRRRRWPLHRSSGGVDARCITTPTAVASQLRWCPGRYCLAGRCAWSTTMGDA